MSEKVYPVPADFAAQANITSEQYQEMYQRSIDNPEGFWADQANEYLTWFKPWDKVLDWSFAEKDLHIEWFKGGKLNVSYNCLDRHLDSRGDQTAILWEGDDPDQDKQITYRELHADVNKFANALKSRGVKRGDRVSIYLPMIPEAVVAMLACTRIGAVHSIVFSAFSPDALKDRILDSNCQCLITSDQSLRGGKTSPFEGQRGQGPVPLSGRAHLHRGQTRRRSGGVARRPRCLVSRGPGRRRSGLPAGGDGCGGSPVHPLYLRLHRQAQGGVAYHRRLSAAGRHDPQDRIRLQGG